MLAHIIAKMKQLKEDKHLTTQQIADRSGIPASTISRILSGQTDNPSFQTVSDIVRAMGGSLDEIFGLRPDPAQEQKHEPAPQPVLSADHAAELLEVYRAQLANKDGWIKRLFFVCVALMGVLITLVFIDVLNGGIGFVRY